MKTLLERKIQLATLKVQQEMMRQFVTSNIYRDYENELSSGAESEGIPVHQFFHELCRKEEEFEATQFPDVARQFGLRGYDENVDHYKIDEALTEKFGDSVDVDSESGGFYAYCDEDILERVEAFLKLRFPTLEFSSKVREGKKNIFSNMTEAKNFLKDLKIEVEHPLKETFKKIQQIEKLKAEFKQKLHAITSDMVQVANNESIPMMKKVDDDVKNKIIKLYIDAVEECSAPSAEDSEDKKHMKQIYKENNLAHCEEYKAQEWFSLKRMAGMLEYGTEGGVQRVFRRKIIDHFGEDLTDMY